MFHFLYPGLSINRQASVELFRKKRVLTSG